MAMQYIVKHTILSDFVKSCQNTTIYDFIKYQMAPIGLYICKSIVLSILVDFRRFIDFQRFTFYKSWRSRDLRSTLVIYIYIFKRVNPYGIGYITQISLYFKVFIIIRHRLCIRLYTKPRVFSSAACTFTQYTIYLVYLYILFYRQLYRLNRPKPTRNLYLLFVTISTTIDKMGFSHYLGIHA